MNLAPDLGKSPQDVRCSLHRVQRSILKVGEIDPSGGANEGAANAGDENEAHEDKLSAPHLEGARRTDGDGPMAMALLRVVVEAGDLVAQLAFELRLVATVGHVALGRTLCGVFITRSYQWG